MKSLEIKLILTFISISIHFGYAQQGTSLLQDDIVPKIEEVINKAVDLEIFSGCILIAKGDEIIFSRAYGEANKDFNIKNTLDTKFNIASGTKPFTSVLTMLLVEQGLISVSDPVSKYLPDFPFGDEITIFHLLTHTSGLGHFSDEDKYIKQMNRYMDFAMILHLFIYKEELLFDKPGTKFSYSNSGVLVLGAIIEKVSGLKYADCLRKNIFEPLGMNNSCSKSMEEVVSNRAVGYTPIIDKKFINTTRLVSPANSATGISTTVNDLFKFVQAINNNRLLNETSKKEMLTPFLKDQDKPYAYLWYVLDNCLYVDYNSKVIGHQGGQPGYRAMYYHYLDSKYTIILLSNYTTGQLIYPMIEAIVFNKDYELPRTPVGQFLYSLIQKEGYNIIESQITEILEKNNYQIRYPWVLNSFGYNLMRYDSIGMAINIFKLNVKLFSNNANVYDSLAEAYMKSGQKDLAIENYKKSLEFNPDNENAKEMLNVLEE